MIEQSFLLINLWLLLLILNSIIYFYMTASLMVLLDGKCVNLLIQFDSMTPASFLFLFLSALTVNVILILLDFKFKRYWYYAIRLVVLIFFSSLVIKYRPIQHPILGNENVILLLYCLTFLLLIVILKGKTVFSEYWINKPSNR